MSKLRLSYLTDRFDRDALVAADEEETERVYEIPAAMFYIDSDIDKKKCLKLEEKAQKIRYGSPPLLTNVGKRT